MQMYNDDITVNLTFYHWKSMGHLQSLIVQYKVYQKQVAQTEMIHNANFESAY